MRDRESFRALKTRKALISNGHVVKMLLCDQSLLKCGWSVHLLATLNTLCHQNSQRTHSSEKDDNMHLLPIANWSDPVCVLVQFDRTFPCRRHNSMQLISKNGGGSEVDLSFRTYWLFVPLFILAADWDGCRGTSCWEWEVTMKLLIIRCIIFSCNAINHCFPTLFPVYATIISKYRSLLTFPHR